jgi:two-component system NtrC family sensor kinase
MADAARILFVDDETHILRSLERVFLEDDYEILTATSGEAALEILERVPPVQVVVSDYRMPRMNGVDFLRRVRGHWPEIVRAVLSGYADTAAIVSAINEGQIYRFIPKPWDDTDLRMTIAAAVEQHKRQAKEIMFANVLQKRIDELERENSFLVGRIAAADARAGEILDALPAGVLVVNGDGAIIRCNPEAESLLGGGDRQPLAGMNDPRIPSVLRTFVEKSTANGHDRSRVTLRGRSVLAAVSVMEASGCGPLVVVVICREKENG